MLTPVGFTTQKQQQTGFKAGYAFKKTDPRLPKLTALNNALVKNEYKGYQYFCFFPYASDIQGKQKAFQQHAKNQMRKLGAKPVEVDTKNGEFLTFAVEKKIDELMKKTKELAASKKTVHKPAHRKRKSNFPSNINRAYTNWLLA